MSIRVTSSTDLRKHLSRKMDEVNEDHVPYVITRSGGKPVVMMSLDDYTAMDETTYLLSSPANREVLKVSIEQLGKEHIVEKTIEELEAMENE